MSRDREDPFSDSPLVIGPHSFRSRLFLGTGKYPDMDTMVSALEVSGTECVTVAVRRLKLGAPEGKSLLDYLDRNRYVLLPNTAGCYTADDALRTAVLGREAGMSNMVKLEVLGDRDTLLPDPVGTLEAAEALVKEGFTVLCYTSDDPIVAQRLEGVGVAAIMPAGAPIGSGQGVLNPNNIRIIVERAELPVVVDAGVGTASDITMAFELGVDGVLLNTGVARARDPVRMARAMKAAAEAGRDAFLAGRIPKRLYGSSSSPSEGTIAVAGE